MRSRLALLLLVVAVAVTLAGCGSKAPSDGRITIRMTDGMRFVPDTVTVTQGDTVTFEAVNTGAVEHELFVGNLVAQDDRETEMAKLGAVGGDTATGVWVPAGQTKYLTLKFSTPGTFFMGCHVRGHWAAGMKGTITVAPEASAAPSS